MIFGKPLSLITLTFLSSTLFFLKKEKIRLPDHRANTHVDSSIIRFIPEGFVIMDQADGELNGDGLIDKILVLKQKQEITEEEKRPVLLLIRQKDNSLIKVVENDDIILSLGDGGIHGDPYHGITIKDGYFSFEHFGGSGWRWNQVITFKYDAKQKSWFLNKVGSDSWLIDDPRKFKNVQFTKKDFGFVPFIKYKNDWTDKK